MNIIKLSWKNILHKPLNSALSVILLMLGVALISFIILVSNQLEERFEKNIKGIDMVVGAKGSPLQLILSAVFQIDNPTGNIPLEESKKLERNRYVGKTIPLSYGDSYMGYRIIGSDTSYLNLYGAELAAGRIWNDEMEVVIGASVANLLNLNVGDTFESSHGLAQEGESHDEHPFEVVGILAPGNSVLDKLIITATESIWHVHDYGEDVEPQITALLVKFRSPMGMIQIPRAINTNTTMQAALPSYEITRLISIMGIGINAIYGMAIGIIIVSALSVFISLYNTLKERKYEMALIRSYGGSRWQLVVLILSESLFIAVTGAVLGLIASRLGIVLLNNIMEDPIFMMEALIINIDELYLLLLTASIGFLAAAIPAISIYKLNISQVLSEG